MGPDYLTLRHEKKKKIQRRQKERKEDMKSHSSTNIEKCRQTKKTDTQKATTSKKQSFTIQRNTGSKILKYLEGTN